MVKLKASTLIETIVASLLISLCFTIGIGFLTRLYASDIKEHVINAIFIAENEMNSLLNSNEQGNRESTYQDYLITGNISNYNNSEDLKLIEVKISLKGKTILNKRRIYLLNNED